MRSVFSVVIVAVTALTFAHAAEAKGCIKGAIVGGIAGHMAGHGVAGAAAGCAIGHHHASKKAAEAQAPDAQAPKK